MGDKKLGRPLTGERKEHDIKVRLDETTYNKLLKYCKESRETKAEAIRQSLKQFLRYNA
jgi:predicted DNA-binding antitoxin AbrB/MazE fold protein